MKKLLLMMILITLHVDAICIMIPHANNSSNVEIDGKYYDWSSLSLGQKDSCRRDKITSKNKEIKKEQQKNIKQEKTDPHYTCIITTNSDGSKAVEINDLRKDWSILTDNEKSSCIKNKAAREKEKKNEQKKNIKEEKQDPHYTCIMFTLDNNWVAEIDGKYYDWSGLTDHEKASCQKDKIERDKEIINEYQSNIDEIRQEKRGNIIWWIIGMIFGFLYIISTLVHKYFRE